MTAPAENAPSSTPTNFIREAIDGDLASGKHTQIVTRFPPEPNGYLHIGHAKSIHLNFGIARDYASPGSIAPEGARCHLRMDDTNPTREDREYIESIQEDVKWLGFDWGTHYFHASDYFPQLHEWAVLLIKAGKAYVCDLTGEEITRSRGTLITPGTPSPYRNRSVEENLDLFERMTRGEFPNGSHVLRARIDMASPNLNMRDPVMYRILHASHPHVGDKWCVYPMYDYAHGQSDWIEGVTHSICTLEFEDHRPLYDWFIDEITKAHGLLSVGSPLPPRRPRQYEFARLNLTYTVMSKRKLLELVKEKYVNGWDDPRMPTISGMRRRGYTPAALRAFCEGIGVARRSNTIELARLEHHLREDLNKTAPRIMGVLHPLKVVIENYPEGHIDELDAINNPEDPAAGTRKVAFSKVIYIEQDDFKETPPPRYFRLFPGAEVRLRYAYFIRCTGVVKDDAGDITEIRATYDPATRGGDAPDKRKVKGTLHWVSAAHAIDADVRLYDTLFIKENAEEVEEGKTWRDNLNPNSVTLLTGCKLEPAAKGARPGQVFQFERNGYFNVDPDSTEDKLIFNRTVTLKDTWAKIEKKQ